MLKLTDFDLVPWVSCNRHVTGEPSVWRQNLISPTIDLELSVMMAPIKESFSTTKRNRG